MSYQEGHQLVTVWTDSDLGSHGFVCFLLFYILKTSKVISGRVPTVCAYGDFIVLPHWETKLPQYYDSIIKIIGLSPIILTLRQPVLPPS